MIEQDVLTHSEHLGVGGCSRIATTARDDTSQLARCNRESKVLQLPVPLYQKKSTLCTAFNSSELVNFFQKLNLSNQLDKLPGVLTPSPSAILQPYDALDHPTCPVNLVENGDCNQVLSLQSPGTFTVS